MHIDRAETYVISSVLCSAVMLHFPAMATRGATVVGEVRLVDTLPLVTPWFLVIPAILALVH